MWRGLTAFITPRSRACDCSVFCFVPVGLWGGSPEPHSDGLWFCAAGIGSGGGRSLRKQRSPKRAAHVLVGSHTNWRCKHSFIHLFVRSVLWGRSLHFEDDLNLQSLVLSLSPALGHPPLPSLPQPQGLHTCCVCPQLSSAVLSHSEGPFLTHLHQVGSLLCPIPWWSFDQCWFFPVDFTLCALLLVMHSWIFWWQGHWA